MKYSFCLQEFDPTGLVYNVLLYVQGARFCPSTHTHTYKHTHSCFNSPAVAACKALGKVLLSYKYTPLKPNNKHPMRPHHLSLILLLLSVGTSCILSFLYLVALSETEPESATYSLA